MCRIARQHDPLEIVQRHRHRDSPAEMGVVLRRCRGVKVDGRHEPRYTGFAARPGPGARKSRNEQDAKNIIHVLWMTEDELESNSNKQSWHH